MSRKLNIASILLFANGILPVVSALLMMFSGGIWANGKIFALVCDNKLFIKPTLAGRKFIGEPTEAPPYPGAKNSFLIEDKLDDREWLHELVRVSLPELPLPKPRKKKKK